MRSPSVQDSFAASVLATGGPGLVLDGSASNEPDLDVLYDAQRWDASMDDSHLLHQDRRFPPRSVCIYLL